MASKTEALSMVFAALVGGTAAFFLTQLSVEVESSSPAPSGPDLPPAPQQPVSTKPLPERSHQVLNQLRVSNRTSYPIRVVLLPRQEAKAQPYNQPLHWDFAPAEGQKNGLLLSRPQGQLHLHDGDVLTAFALDGSRRYWGPYVVGQTVQPTPSSSGSEWHLLLQP